MTRPNLIARGLLALLFLSGGFSAVNVAAEGDAAPTYQRERAMQKFKGCRWTDEMGQYLYQCIKKNDGFGSHWCHDEALEVYCPAQFAAQKTDAQAAQPAADKPGN